MTTIVRNGFAALAALVFVVACTAAPVYSVSGSPVNTNTAKASLDDVGKAIKTAGINLGWQMKDVKPGHMIGTLNLRSHQAIVDITYDSKKYDIAYKDSSNLNYNGSTIHKNYNSWVQNLDRRIQAQLSGI
ncbi:MAG: hypothetical protein ACREV9_00725 [Burkholderiales bacterium]